MLMKMWLQLKLLMCAGQSDSNIYIFIMINFNLINYSNGSSDELETLVLAVILRHSWIIQPVMRVLKGAYGKTKL